MNSFLFTDNDSLALNINNKPYNIDSSNPNWDLVISALKAGDFEAIPDLINQTKALEKFVAAGTDQYTNIEVNIEYGTIVYNGEPVASVIIDHIFRMKEQGFDIKPMLRFLDNLLSNPSKRAVDELYGFLQYGKMPITEDGCFIAYKSVRGDYKSIHDGKTDNSIGSRPSMPRNLVNENSNETCSTGLHFCSHEYLKHFNGKRVVILKINPRDVVSIPADYNNTKGRACAYEVVGELTPDQVREAMSTNVFVDAVHNGAAPAAKPAAFKGKGPKESAGTFARGYQAGYDAQQTGAAYDDTAPLGLTDVQEQNFMDGYDQGWADAEDAASRRYVYTGGATAPAVDQASVDFHQGYKVGYADGRSRNASIVAEWEANLSSFNGGYILGYEDGRGHKRRRF